MPFFSLLSHAFFIFVVLAGRAPQIAANFAAKSTGELSQTTQVLMSAGSVARIFTTVQEGGSSSMIGAYLVRGAARRVKMHPEQS